MNLILVLIFTVSLHLARFTWYRALLLYIVLIPSKTIRIHQNKKNFTILFRKYYSLFRAQWTVTIRTNAILSTDVLFFFYTKIFQFRERKKICLLCSKRTIRPKQFIWIAFMIRCNTKPKRNNWRHCFKWLFALSDADTEKNFICLKHQSCLSLRLCWPKNEKKKSTNCLEIKWTKVFQLFFYSRFKHFARKTKKIFLWRSSVKSESVQLNG